MKKVFIFVCIATGVGIALFTTFFDEIEVKVVMSCIGAMVGAIFGCAVAGLFGKGGTHLKRLIPDDDNHAYVGTGVRPVDLAHNYWRDKGHPPFTDPHLEPERGRHMFDGDY